MDILSSLLLLGGWIGVCELLWTAYDEYRTSGRIEPNTRALVYLAVMLGYLLLEARNLPLPNL